MGDSDRRTLQFDEELFNLAGSYMRKVCYHSKNGHLCAQCGGFKLPDFNLCASCQRLENQARNAGVENQLADRIAMGVYADEPSGQMYKTMWDYKASEVEAWTLQQFIVYAILNLSLRLHGDCLADKAGAPVTAWGMVPSTSHSRRYGHQHPLHKIIEQTLPTIPEIRLLTNAGKTRALNPDMFTLDGETNPNALSHVLLIDDSWVTGATVESAAIALKQAGAAQVSIFCVARVIDFRYMDSEAPGLSKSFLKTLKYGQGLCPWREH